MLYKVNGCCKVIQSLFFESITWPNPKVWLPFPSFSPLVEQVGRTPLTVVWGSGCPWWRAGLIAGFPCSQAGSRAGPAVGVQGSREHRYLGLGGCCGPSTALPSQGLHAYSLGCYWGLPRETANSLRRCHILRGTGSSKNKRKPHTAPQTTAHSRQSLQTISGSLQTPLTPIPGPLTKTTTAWGRLW